MSQAVEEESFYDVPLESMKRKSTEDIDVSEKVIDKKAKIESAKISDNVKIENQGENEGNDEQVVPEIPSSSGKRDENNEPDSKSPKKSSKFIGEVQVNPDPFEFIEQIQREDFSDSENESPTIYYEYDSDSSEYELEYFEVSSLWINMSDPEIEE